MAEYNELYRRARYYDIVFRRDVGLEIDFMLAAARLMAASSRNPSSISPAAPATTPARRRAAGSGASVWTSGRR
jgi:hypothetical protein